MSNVESVVQEIMVKTTNNDLSWDIVGNGYASGLIFQSGHVFRIFRTMYNKNGTNYEVLLIEKKYGDPDWDFAIEKYKPEMMFISNGMVISVIDEYVVDVSYLIALIRLVESKSSQVKNLFG